MCTKTCPDSFTMRVAGSSIARPVYRTLLRTCTYCCTLRSFYLRLSKDLCFVNFGGCRRKNQSKNNGELCSASCLETQCRESDIYQIAYFHIPFYRCAFQTYCRLKTNLECYKKVLLLGPVRNILEPRHQLSSSCIVALKMRSLYYQRRRLKITFSNVWNAIDIKENFYDPGGISNTFFHKCKYWLINFLKGVANTATSAYRKLREISKPAHFKMSFHLKTMNSIEFCLTIQSSTTMGQIHRKGWMLRRRRSVHSI